MSDGTGRVAKLLRGEQAAIETYEEALEGVDPEAPQARILGHLLEEHRRSVAALREGATEVGRVMGDGSGVWGAFSRAVEKTAKWLGDGMALKALKEGEVHGVSEYRTALADEDLPPGLRALLRDELLPRQEEHVATLDALIAALEQPERLRHLADRVRERVGG